MSLLKNLDFRIYTEIWHLWSLCHEGQANLNTKLTIFTFRIDEGFHECESGSLHGSFLSALLQVIFTSLPLNLIFRWISASIFVGLTGPCVLFPTTRFSSITTCSGWKNPILSSSASSICMCLLRLRHFVKRSTTALKTWPCRFEGKALFYFLGVLSKVWVGFLDISVALTRK